MTYIRFPVSEEETCSFILATLAIAYPETMQVNVIQKKLWDWHSVLLREQDILSLLEKMMKSHHVMKVSNKYRIWSNGLLVIEEDMNWSKYPLITEKEYIVRCPKCKAVTDDVRKTTNPILLAAKCNTCNIKWKHKME